MLGVGGVTFIAIDRNLRISLWAGRFGVEVGVVKEGLGGGELVEGAMEPNVLQEHGEKRSVK